MAKRNKGKGVTTSDKAFNFQLKVNKHAFISKNVSLLIDRTTKYGALVFCSYFLYLSIDSFAGKTTVANILTNILIDLRVNEWICYIFGSSGVAYGLVQRRLKQKNVKRMSERIDKLERRKNPDKQSSNITPTGNTKKEDIL